MSCGPLHGVKVIEVAHMLSTPLCTQLLGDLGADVVKVEAIGKGDRAREGAPFSKVGNVSYTFLSRNRSKRSMCLDLAKEEGKGIMYKLVEASDVFLHNLRRNTMASLALDYSDLKKVNPMLIYGAITGFGDKGPYKDLPGQDMQVQAMSGILSLSGYPDRGNTPIGTMLGDSAAGMLMAFGVVTALYNRDRTGEGQELSTSLLAGSLALQPATIGHYLGTYDLPVKRGMRSYLPPPYGLWTCRDGKEIALSNYRDKDWVGFCAAIERPDLVDDPRFADQHLRRENREELTSLLEGILGTRDQDEWVRILRENGQWVVPVRDYADMFNDVDVWENDLIAEVQHPTAGTVKSFGAPVRFFGTPATPERQYHPLLGEHTRDILGELGYSDEETEALFRSKAVG